MIVYHKQVALHDQSVFVALCSCRGPVFLHAEAWNIVEDDPDLVEIEGTPYELIISRGVGLPLSRWRDRLKVAWMILIGRMATVDSINLVMEDAIGLRDYINDTLPKE